MSSCRLCMLFILGMFVLSCASAGNKIDMQAIKNNIKIGESTREDVLKVCGEPLSVKNDIKNGLEILHYARVDKSITGLGVLTHVVGVEEWKSNTTVVDIYLKDGVVSDIKSESSEIVKFNTR